MNAEYQEFIETLRQVMRSPGDVFHMRTATVTAVNRTTNKYSITQGGATLTNVPALKDVWAVVGDVVDVVYDDTSPRIVGVVGATTWVTPTLAGVWVQPGADRGAAYTRDSMGFVHLRGYATNGTAATIFTLPSGFRPAAKEYFVSLAGGTNKPAQIQIDTAGVVSAAGFLLNGTEYAQLSGITFIADGS